MHHGSARRGDLAEEGRERPIVVGCLHLLDEIVRKHGGTVDKYLGDCVLALFGVPQAIEDAPRAALNAATLRAHVPGARF